ncbi:MAG: HtaA domain-containing protein [Blastocatellia bacterium]|nr:HtaA domain-containing protein [Blastocatellia bacterium]
MKKLLVLVAVIAFSVGVTAAQERGHASGQTSTSQIELVWGSTNVDLSPGFLSALSSLNIAPSTIFPASLRGTRVSFPITDGSLDRQTLRGEIVHNGGLRLKRGNTEVKLKSFIIDTTGNGIVLTGLVSANGTTVGRVPLFDLQLPSSSSATSLRIDRVSLNGVSVRLRQEAATALNGVFETNAFVAGFGIGTASVRGYGYGA